MGLVLCAAVVGLLACSKSSDNKGGIVNVDANGDCSQQYIDAYKSVSHAIHSASEALQSASNTDAERTQALRTLQNACQDFFANRAGVTCSAPQGTSKRQVSSSDLSPGCQAADAYLKNQPAGSARPLPIPVPNEPTPDNPAPTPNPAPNPVPPSPSNSKDFDDVQAEQIQLRPFSIQELKRVSDPRNNLYMVNGRLGKLQELSGDVSAGASLCFMTFEGSDWDVREGAILKVERMTEANTSSGNRSLTLSMSNGALILSCLKMNQSPFKIGEVRRSIGTVLDLSIQ